MFERIELRGKAATQIFTALDIARASAVNGVGRWNRLALVLENVQWIRQKRPWNLTTRSLGWCRPNMRACESQQRLRPFYAVRRGYDTLTAQSFFCLFWEMRHLLGFRRGARNLKPYCLGSIYLREAPSLLRVGLVSIVSVEILPGRIASQWLGTACTAYRLRESGSRTDTRLEGQTDRTAGRLGRAQTEETAKTKDPAGTPAVATTPWPPPKPRDHVDIEHITDGGGIGGARRSNMDLEGVPGHWGG